MKKSEVVEYEPECPLCGVDEDGRDKYELEFIDDDCLINERSIKMLCKGCGCEFAVYGHTVWTEKEITVMVNTKLEEYTKTFNEILERFEWVAESWADSRKDPSDWCIPDDGLGPVTISQLQKHIFHENSAEEEFATIEPNLWYLSDNRPHGCIHIADYIFCWARAWRDKGVMELFGGSPNWEPYLKKQHEHFFHYLACSSMGTEQNLEDLDDDEIDLAKRVNDMIERAYARNPKWGELDPKDLGSWGDL